MAQLHNASEKAVQGVLEALPDCIRIQQNVTLQPDETRSISFVPEQWAVGDQRSNFAGHVFRIDPATARLVGDPVKLDLDSKMPGGFRNLCASSILI